MSESYSENFENIPWPYYSRISLMFPIHPRLGKIDIPLHKKAAELVTFTEKILNRKLHFLCSEQWYLKCKEPNKTIYKAWFWSPWYKYQIRCSRLWAKETYWFSNEIFNKKFDFEAKTCSETRPLWSVGPLDSWGTYANFDYFSCSLWIFINNCTSA